jgi:cobalt-zinc-cadmium efflux system membrane fusion protein
MRSTVETVCFLLALALLGISTGCRHSESEEDSESQQRAAAEVGVRLSDEARKNIGVLVTLVESTVVQSTIDTPGWLAVVPGHNFTAKAHATGFLIPEPEQPAIELGSVVAAEQSLGTLRVLVSPQEEAQLVALKEEADIMVRQSKAALTTAEARLQRVQELGESGTIPEKELELVTEAVEKARAAYEESQHQFPFLPTEPYERPLQLNPVGIDSPLAGRVVDIHARPRQLVLQGEPLWTIADWSSLWLRVPVFEGDLPDVDPKAPVEVLTPGREAPILAKPSGVPQPTQSGRRTVDLIYMVANLDGTLRPGQAVSVQLPTANKAEHLVVPRSAILWDGMGNAWVYVEFDHNLFRRQKIQVGQSVGHMIVVEQGLVEGQSVVTAGAEALYSEEFKDQIQVLEDDD